MLWYLCSETTKNDRHCFAFSILNGKTSIIIYKSSTVLWPKFGAMPISVNESMDEYKDLNVQWIPKQSEQPLYKHFVAVHDDRRHRPPLSLTEIHNMLLERAKLYKTSCYIQPNHNNNQVELFRSAPFDGEIGLASAKLTCRLGLWKCVIRAGNSIIDLFDGKFHLDVYTNLCVVLEVIGERNKWKCCYGYQNENKIEFASECPGVFKGKEDTNSGTYNVCKKCRYVKYDTCQNLDTPERSHIKSPYIVRPKTELVHIIRELKCELEISKRRIKL